MSKTVNNFLVSMAIILFAFFGFSACKGPLDNLKIDISSQSIQKVEAGYETTLVLGDETTDRLTVRAEVGGASGDVSTSVLWSTADNDKVQITDIKKVGDFGYATIVAKSVTEFNRPAKIVVSSIEKTEVNVALFVNVVAEAKTITPRNNTAIAVKGSLYEPNVLDFFSFSDEQGSTNVTVPNYDFELSVDGTVLNPGQKIPYDATSMTIRFIPAQNTVFADSEIYTSRVLEVPAEKIVLYEGLETANFALMEDGVEQSSLKDGVLELVINKDNGQGHNYYISNFNKDTMNLSFEVLPQNKSKNIDVYFDEQTGFLSFFGQEETNKDEAYVQFVITYKDPSISSTGVYRLPFSVVAYPETISINGHIAMDEDFDLTVYDTYIDRGQLLSISLAPYSTQFENVEIKLDGDTDDSNLAWFVGDSTTKTFVGKEGIVVKSGTKLYLLYEANSQSQNKNHTYTITAQNTNVSKKLNITLDFGVNEISINDVSTLDSKTGNFVLSLTDVLDETADIRTLEIKAGPDGVSAESILNAYEIEDESLVSVVSKSFEGSVVKLELKPLRTGTTSVVWTAPTGATYTQQIEVFSAYNKYSLSINGQTNVVGEINYVKAQNQNDQQTEDDEQQSEQTNEEDLRDANNIRIIQSIRVATKSSVDFSNTLSPANAKIDHIGYVVENANIVTYMGNTTNSLAQLYTGSVSGNTKVSCEVYYYALDENFDLVLKKDVISFVVYTYYKAKSLELSDSDITLYATATGGEQYIYNTSMSKKQVSAYVLADGIPDVLLDKTIWEIQGTQIPFQVVGSITKSGSQSTTQQGKIICYGSYITITATNTQELQDRYVTSIRVSLQDYNTTLSATLTITIVPFQSVTSATVDTGSVEKFVITKNEQTKSNTVVSNVAQTNRMVELYVEQSQALDASFSLLTSVRPSRATNKNVQYVIFDYENDELSPRTEKEIDGTLTSYYTSQNTSKLVSIVDGKIVVNYDQVIDENSNITKVSRTGRAVVYVLAEDALKKRAEQIYSFEDIEIIANDARPILLKIEIVVADGSNTAYRIYNAQDFLKIYAEPTKNFEVMNDISNIDLSALIEADGTFAPSFSGKLSSFASDDLNVVRTITFDAINIQKTSQHTTYNQRFVNNSWQNGDLLTPIFGDLFGTVQNLNFVVNGYTYNAETGASKNNNIAIFANLKTAEQDGQTFVGCIKNVNLVVKSLNLKLAFDSANSNNQNIGVVATNQGVIQNFSVEVSNAVYEFDQSTADATLGVANNQGQIKDLSVSGNIILKGSTITTNFGGAVANNQGSLENLLSMVNAKSTTKLNIVGGVVAQNSGDIVDAKYLVVNDGQNNQFYGLKLDEATLADGDVSAKVVLAGGVVGKNTGSIEYAYAASFVPNFGVVADKTVSGVAGENTGTINKVFASIKLVAETQNPITQNPITSSNNATNYYYTTTTADPAGSDIPSTPDESVWKSNNAFTNGYAKDGTYYYLVKENGDPYLPDVPSSLVADEKLIFENVLSTVSDNVYKFVFNKYVAQGNTATNENTFEFEQSSQTKPNPTFNLFGGKISSNSTQTGVIDLEFPPLQNLDNLLVYVNQVAGDQNVVRVIKGVYASNYRVQFVNNGTAVLKITSSLNNDAYAYVQICVLKGFASYKISTADGEEVDDTITIQKDESTEFVVDYLDDNENPLSQGTLQAGLDVTKADGSNANIEITQQNDSFILTPSQVADDYKINLQKVLKAKFFDLTDIENITSDVLDFKTGVADQKTVNVVTGPTKITLDHGDLEVFAGDRLFTNVTIDTDAWGDNDALEIKYGTQSVDLLKTTSSAELTVDGIDITIKSIASVVTKLVGEEEKIVKVVYNLEYSLANPELITETKTYALNFVAGSQQISYSLTIKPQNITSIDMYHYIDVQQTTQTGELEQAGGTPTSNLVAGSFGLLKVTVDPDYVEFGSVEIRSDVLAGGYGITFDQRLFDVDSNKYILLNNANITVTSNSISTSSRISNKTQNGNEYDGTLYFRTFVPASTPNNSVFNIYVTVFDKNGNVMISKQKKYNLYAPRELSISYDNYSSSQNIAYIAKNTGEDDGFDIYGQNANVVTTFVQSGLLESNIEIVDIKTKDNSPVATTDEVFAELGEFSKSADGQTTRYHLAVKGLELGTTFTLKLTAKTYISSVLTTLTREMKFVVVDFVVNQKWNTPEQSYVLSGEYTRQKYQTIDSTTYNSFVELGGAISNVKGDEWNYVFNTSPVQISIFATEKRANLALLENIETSTAKQLLSSIPEISFDYANSVTITKIQNFLKVLNCANTNITQGNFNFESIYPFSYENGTSYIVWGNTADKQQISLTDINLNIADNYYYIEGKNITANNALQASFYLNYQDGVANFESVEGQNVHYNYQFSIAYTEQNSMEHPIPVYDLEDLRSMQAGYSYILMKDIQLDKNSAFVPLTVAIASLDGNNYALKLSGHGFDVSSGNGSIGLFATVNEDTILKNITLLIEKNLDLNLSNSTTTDQTVGLIAATNNGTMTNCNVVANTKLLSLITNTDTTSTIRFGGLVGTNTGYITNSSVCNLNLTASYGVVAGFVSQNSGLISASFVNDSILTYDVVQEQENLTMFAGFVAQNESNGQIFESFVGGIDLTQKPTETNTETFVSTTGNRGVKLLSNSKFGAFVYDNWGEIFDSFATADLDNRQTAVASGFVYANNGVIKRAYSASLPSSQTNTFVRPFVGTTTTNGQNVANNQGTIQYAFYYEPVYNAYQKSAEVAIGTDFDAMTNVDKQVIWSTFSFASDGGNDGVWKALPKQNTANNTQSTIEFGPQLINPNIKGLKPETHQTISKIDNTESGAVYYYRLEGATFNTIECVDLIASAEDFNSIFDRATSEDVCASDKEYYARIIKPIDLSVLGANNQELKTITKILRGTIVGNNLTLSGVDVSYLDKTSVSNNTDVSIACEDVLKLLAPDAQQTLADTSTSSVGLFGEIQGGSLSNLNVELSNVLANNKTRFYVGGIAGRVVDGKLFNLNLVGDDSAVLGYNIVGGLAGIVLGKSRVSNITVADISVTSDFEHDGSAEQKFIYNYDLVRMIQNTQLQNLTSPKELSVAGGVVGILDLFDYKISGETSNPNVEYEKTIVDSQSNPFASTTLNFVGSNTVLGQVAGGVVGVVGTNTTLADAHHTVGATSRIKSSVYGGGLVGQNNGGIKYSSVEYEDSIQQLVNAANTGQIVETANEKLFDTIGYTAAVGGLVGANFGQTYKNGQSGAIRYANSSVYVNAPNAQNVGGLVGVVYGGDLRAVYATGYVLGYGSGSVGGLFGTIDQINPENQEQSINTKLNVADSLLVNIKNPYPQNTVLGSQRVLIDFAVAQNNWASDYYLNYQNLKTSGYLGGFAGCITDPSLFNTSHNGDLWETYKDKTQGFTEDMTVVLNYYVNKIPAAQVAVNADSYDGLELVTANLMGQDNTAAQHFAVGETRNFAYKTNEWDWFALWDDYSIASRNLDDTPKLQLTIAPSNINLSSAKDFLNLYWHPDRTFTLENDIDFNETGDKQIQYIMAGSTTTPFSGTFNGKNHTISNIVVANYLTDIGGLFGVVSGGTIENVVLNNVSVSNLTTTTVGGVETKTINNVEIRSIGGLIGYATNATITNVALTGVDINSIIQNTNNAKTRYVGGLVGFANSTRFVGVGVEGIEQNKGLKLLQTGEIDGQTDVLYVGGFAGFVGGTSTITINEDTSQTPQNTKALLNVSNISTTLNNITNKTYFGSGVGGINNAKFDTFITSGENNFDGVQSNELFVAGIFADVDGNNNSLKSSYAYSTLNLKKLTTSNPTISYDLLMQNDAKIDLTPASVSSSEEIENKCKNFSAVSIVYMDNQTANKNIQRYYQTETQGDVEKEYYIPLDPFYSLATVDQKFDEKLHDIENAKTLYQNFVVFEASQDSQDYFNKVGYKRTNNNVETTILNKVFNKIAKLYYNNGRQIYGGAKILSNTTTKIDEGEYYIIANYYGADLKNTLSEIKGFLNGHNFNLRIHTPTLADKISGVVCGVELHFLKNAFTEFNEDVIGTQTYAENTEVTVPENQIMITPNATYASGETVTFSEETTVTFKNYFNKMWNNKTEAGVVANTNTGVVSACGTTAYSSFNSKEIATVDLDVPAGCTFGGLVGVNEGLINNCWSHIKYNITSSTDTSTFGGIVGKDSGGIVANVNYYGNITGSINEENKNTFGGIVGTTVQTETTTLYKVMSYIFIYSGTYHISKDNSNFNLIDDQDTIDGKTYRSTYYFSLTNATDEIGERLGFYEVFSNLSREQNKPSIFKMYYGIWDEEQDGINFGLPTLKIEPKVESLDGRDEDHAIEIPNELYFAEMLKYEAGTFGRYYKLTKGDAGTLATSSVYDLAQVLSYMNHQEATTVAGGNFSGHILGNNKTLRWKSESTPLPLVDKITQGSASFAGVVSKAPFIQDIEFVNDSNNGCANLVANEVLSGTLSNITLTSKTITISGEGDFGVMVGTNKGTISNCSVKANITISSTQNANIGLVAGINSRTIEKVDVKGNIQSEVNSSSLFVGGVVGQNTGWIISKVEQQNVLVDENTLLYCVTNLQVSGEAPVFVAESKHTFDERKELEITSGEYELYQIINFENALVSFGKDTTFIEITEQNGSQTFENKSFLQTAGSNLTVLNGRYAFVSGSYTVYDYFVVESDVFVDIEEGSEILTYNKQTGECINNPIQSGCYYWTAEGNSEYAFVVKQGKVTTYSVKNAKRMISNVEFIAHQDNTVLMYVTKSSEEENLNKKLATKTTLAAKGNSITLDKKEAWFAVVEGVVEFKERVNSITGNELVCSAENTIVVGYTPNTKTNSREIETIALQTTVVDVVIDTQGISNVGGIAGQSTNTIKDMYIKANIEARSNIGGVAGQNSGIVEGVVVDGTSITANDHLGGVAGTNTGYITRTTVKNLTLTATDEDSFVGGVAGSNESSESDKNFDAEILNPKVVNVTINGKGNTVAGIAGYNSGKIYAGINNNKGDIILNNTAITIASPVCADNTTLEFYTGYVTAQNFGIIQFGASNTADFSGTTITFDFASLSGQTNITNLYVGGIAGLNWGEIDQANITTKIVNENPIQQKIALTTTFVTDSENNLYVGGLVGKNEISGSVRDIKKVDISISTDDGLNVGTSKFPTVLIGGAVAQNDGYVSGITVSEQNSVTKGTVSSDLKALFDTPNKAKVGGVVSGNTRTGVVYGLTYQNSNTPAIQTNVSDAVGGIVAENEGLVLNCVLNNSKIVVAKNSANTGGIVGHNQTNGIVSGCTAQNSTISGYTNVGGIVGQNQGTITSSQTLNLSSAETNLVTDKNTTYVFENTEISTTNDIALNIPTNAKFNSSNDYQLKINANTTTSKIYVAKSTTQRANTNIKINVDVDTPIILIDGTRFVLKKDAKPEENSPVGDFVYLVDAIVTFTNTNEDAPQTITFNGTVCASGENLNFGGASAINGVISVPNDSNIVAKGGQGYSVSAVTATSITTSTTTTVNGSIDYQAGSSVQLGSLENNGNPVYGTQIYQSDSLSSVDGYLKYPSQTTIGIKGQVGIKANTTLTFEQGTYLKIAIPESETAYKLKFNGATEVVYYAENVTYTYTDAENNESTSTYNLQLTYNGDVVRKYTEKASGDGRVYDTFNQDDEIELNYVNYYNIGDNSLYMLDGGVEAKHIIVPLYLPNGGSITFESDMLVDISKIEVILFTKQFSSANVTVFENTELKFEGNTKIKHSASTQVLICGRETFDPSLETTVRVVYNDQTLTKYFNTFYTLTGSETYKGITFAYVNKDYTLPSSGVETLGYYVYQDEKFVESTRENCAYVLVKINGSQDQGVTFNGNYQSVSQGFVSGDIDNTYTANAGATITYQSASVTYNQNTTSNITGTVVYTPDDGNTNNKAWYPAETEITYTNPGSISFVSNTQILVNGVEKNCSAYTELHLSASDTIKFINDTTVIYNYGGSSFSVEYTGQTVRHFAEQTINISGTETYTSQTVLTINGTVSAMTGEVGIGSSVKTYYISQTVEQDNQNFTTAINMEIVGHENVGGVVGYNNKGYANNSQATNIELYTINVDSTLGDSKKIGGFVGFGEGTKIAETGDKVDQYSTNFKNCTASNITVDKATTDGDYAEMIGGFAGYLLTTKLESCGVTGKIQLTGAYTMGGFIGQTGKGKNKTDADANTEVILVECYMTAASQSKITSKEKLEGSLSDYQGSSTVFTWNGLMPSIDFNNAFLYAGVPWATPTYNSQNVDEIIGSDPIENSYIDNMDYKDYDVANIALDPVDKL